ncbi:MAG TPA: phosphatase PAP2 family protein [Luteimonas sp.]|nr:phosphatase PAP2 family protein [Luteimonas sp.]
MLLAVAAIVLGAVFHLTRLDLVLATPYYDPVNHTFPWRYAWVSKYLVHRYLKYVLLAIGVGVWAVALRLRGRPPADGFFASHRRRWWCVAWSFVAVPVVIAVLRRLSPMHCPWEIVDFGGYAPYFDLFSAAPAGVRPGHCFPAAFVASGSWLLAFALLWYPQRKVRCVAVGIVALLLAFAMGWVQQMRGAHFLSHTLWSLWVSWAVVLAVHAASGAWREREPGLLERPR